MLVEESVTYSLLAPAYSTAAASDSEASTNKIRTALRCAPLHCNFAILSKL